MQDSDKILPQFLNTDTSYENLNKDESPFIKGLSVGINANEELGNGTNNPTNEGQNVLVLTPTRSNKVVPKASLPLGINKNNGSFESITTQEFYYFNYNSNGNHGIYVLNGNTGQWSKIIEDKKLNFSDNPEHYISEHRVRIRVRYDEKKNIVEKYLTWTDGNVWQGWVNVIAATETNGFDVSLYPYWQLQPPHFDREELLQYAVRPPMYVPIIKKLPNTEEDLGRINQILDNAFQFCYQIIYTDGRQTTVSPYSVPSIVKTTDFLSNPDLLPKKVELELYAGSCMVESINIYFRRIVYRKNEAGTDLLTWSDWYLYDTINKYSNCGVNAESVIGNKYWLRKNAWEGFNYDSVKNTIKYVFDNSKTAQITPQELFERLQDMPQLSVAMTDLGDSIAFANNREGYNNLPCEITNKLSVNVSTEKTESCTLPFRKIRLYVYVGRERGNSSTGDSPRTNFIWHSQVGYYDGEDKKVRFGSTYLEAENFNSTNIVAKINVDESKLFELDFADKEGFRVYLKGTPYYADAKWYQVKEDFTLSELNGLIDRSNPSDLEFIKTTYQNLSFFVGVFDLEVPAGRYIATLGRHNIDSSGDYRNTSTYILGVANSRLASNVTYNASLSIFNPDNDVTVRTVKPDAIVTNSKEIEIDCTNADVDVWGNGKDLFYVLCPFIGRTSGRSTWCFIEGYLKEDRKSNIGVELFPYELTKGTSRSTGVVTDKNGFFFGYTWSRNNANQSDIRFNAIVNCAAKSFEIPINEGDPPSSWKNKNIAYLADFNSGSVGFANRVILKGKITDLLNTVGYSNISISIVNGDTTFTNNKGEFTLIIHNGEPTPRVRFIYINAAGSFLITLKDCGVLPIFNYNEALVPCKIVSERRYADINQAVVVQGGDYLSLKSNASYISGIVVADLAGRQSFVNKTGQPLVTSFLQRNNTLPTYFSWNLLGSLGLNTEQTKDIKWIGFYTSLASNYKGYTQWVGDKIEFIDDNGNVTTTPSTAVLVRITITSLLYANIQKNFTLLSTYQFAQNDRIRVLDDGDNNLFDTTTYGEGIDVEILGSNYNQAAINANLITPPNNTVLSNTETVGSNPTTLYLNYDSRFDKLKDKTGFWIELYTPKENNDKLPFFEITWYPVINGEIAEYVGGGVSNPVYFYPKTGRLNYWDTYQIRRSINIPNVGNKFIQHIFESPNITDSWGNKVSSGGRPNAINPYAQQMWYRDSIIRSDDFISSGSVNGLGTFRIENKKTFKGYQRGGIVFISCQFSVIFFGCENNFFVTDFNYNYIYANAQGIQIANLDNNLGNPHQKVGSDFGISYDNTRTVIIEDKSIYWYDKKNEAFVESNYTSAKDISDLTDEKGRKYGIKSYLVKKTQFINNWNNTHSLDSIFDVLTGIDLVRKNIFFTFRPRRKNTNKVSSYVNEVRNIKLDYQETIVYNIDTGRWTKFENFCPDGYGKLRGNESGVELISFFAGIPYIHNQFNKRVLDVVKGKECCPVGYVKVGDNCVKTSKVLATKISDITFVATQVSDIAYGTEGTRIYSTINNNGTGVYTQIPLSNTFWTNPSGQLLSPLNRVGFWNNTPDYSPTNVFVDVTIPITVYADKTYYLGISGDNVFGLTVDCTEYFLAGTVVNFKTWNIYPIFLTAGVHFIKLKNMNTGTPAPDNPAAFGVELYDNTPDEIYNADSYGDLNILFTSSSLFGDTVEGFNYSCNGSCGAIILENGNYYCVSTDTIPTDCVPDTITEIKGTPTTFLNFYGKQTEPVLIGVLNKKSDVVKILQSLRQDSLGENMYVDMIYNSQKNSFSYIPLNHWREKEKNTYAAVLRDMVSYLEPNSDEKFRSTLQQGKRLFGETFIVRFVGDYNTLGNYFQVSGIYYLFANSAPTKP